MAPHAAQACVNRQLFNLHSPRRHLKHSPLRKRFDGPVTGAAGRFRANGCQLNRLSNLRGKGERSKGRRGLEQEKRARERGISAADGRGWSWGGYRKKSSGLGLEGGYQKGRFQGGGTRHTHRHTDIYIYKYIHIVRYMYKYQVMGFARQRVTGGSTLLQRGWG